MDNLPDYELEKSANPPVYTPPPRRSSLPWIAAVVGVVILVGVFVYLRRADVAVEPDPTASVDEPVAPATLGTDVEPVDLPSLDDTDALVRRLIGMLSSHPQVAAWLATDGLIRNFVVVVENISLGQTPAGHLRALRPRGSFRVVERGDRFILDSRNYDRYNGLADAAASIDAAGAARLYSMLKPRIEDAYGELGHQEPFDRALERAIVSLLRAPLLEGPVAVEPRGAAEYQFADSRIERLTPAQKQLVRMGPRNVRAIQQKLREIALALGVPAERLPA